MIWNNEHIFSLVSGRKGSYYISSLASRFPIMVKIANSQGCNLVWRFDTKWKNLLLHHRHGCQQALFPCHMDASRWLDHKMVSGFFQDKECKRKEDRTWKTDYIVYFIVSFSECHFVTFATVIFFELVCSAYAISFFLFSFIYLFYILVAAFPSTSFSPFPFPSLSLLLFLLHSSAHITERGLHKAMQPVREKRSLESALEDHVTFLSYLMLIQLFQFWLSM